MTQRILFAQLITLFAVSSALAQTPTGEKTEAPAPTTEVWVASSLSTQEDAPIAAATAKSPEAPVATLMPPTAVAQVGPPATPQIDAPLAPIQEVLQPSPPLLTNGPAGMNSKFWASGDYMSAWIHSASLPPLVTSSPAGTARGTAGVLGAPGTTTLFGDRTGGDYRSGVRINAGYWFDSDRNIGIEGGFLIVESHASLYAARSNGSMILARPYTDAVTGRPQAVLIAYPGSSSGAVNVRAETGNFYTGNLDLTEKVLETSNYRLTAIGGYRYFDYSESLAIQQTINPTSGGFVPGTSIVSSDHFGVRNEFHGMDMGLRSEFFWDRLSLEVLSKVALGNLRSVVSINGLQTASVPGSAPVSSLGGVYALRSNIRSYADNYFGTLPEFGATVKWQIRPYLQARLGYSLFLLDGIARAGNQVNTTITSTNFPPATGTGGQPIFNLDRSFFWLQSVNFGLNFTY